MFPFFEVPEAQFEIPNTQYVSHYECRITPAPQKNIHTQKEIKKTVYKVMTQLDGWCSQTKAMVLMDIIFNHQPQVVVEIGIFGGKSFIPMAYAMKHGGNDGVVYGIDPWEKSESVIGFQDANYEWWSKVDHEKVYTKFTSKIKQLRLADVVHILRTSSKDAPCIYNIDVIHIDGNHSEESALFDVQKWVPLVRRGGIIIFDDIDWPCTYKATQWLDANCYRVTTFQENNIWGIWVKK